ncbi:MAG: GatB/YqeY domain-containing protein [Acidobacteriota bacterium]|nr:GatB/YqeY domain-containing protein [Acidobacteriota bacterium]MDH3786899.1 GatB/YqeY domain-containing protein [Acidobacteriota bacterium]
MSIKSQIEKDVIQSLRDGKKEVVTTLRMLKSKLQEREVALRSEHGVDYKIDDEEATKAVSAYAKQRRDSIESYKAAGRDELVDKEQRELDIVNSYLPEQLDADTLRMIVTEAVAEVGATGPQQMGQVMKIVMPKVQGQADGKQVNAIVRELIASTPDK